MAKAGSYKCISCDHIWTEQTCGPTQCPKCDAMYVLWTNWPHDKPDLTPMQQANIAEVFNSPFTTMH